MWLRLARFKRIQPQQPAAVAAGFACFTIRHSNGQWLGASKGQTIRCAAAAAPRVILCVPDRQRQFGFLFSADAEPLSTEGDSGPWLAIAVRIERGAAGAPIGLLHPINPVWRLGLTDGAGRADGVMVFAHREPNADCDFGLEPIETAGIILPVRQAAQALANTFSVPASWQAVFDALRSGRLRRELAGPLLSCLPVDEMETLAARLVDDEALRDTLRPCLREDRWISTRLDQLADWNRNRNDTRAGRGALNAAEVDDLPGAKKSLCHKPKLGLALCALARRSVRPRRMACVVGSARNEGPYLLDWIAHHRAIGFDHVFIYTNDNTDGSDDLLALLARAGVVTWLDNRSGPDILPQFRAYAHALSVLPQTLDYRWTLVADLDEYMAYDPDRFRSVSDYLIWQEGRRAEAIALPWLIYAGGRTDVWTDAPCTERFLKREETANHHVKSIFRTHLHWSSSCHNPLPMMECPINYRAQNRQPHIAKSPENNLALAHNPQATHAWIAHYIFKSASEAMMKIHRGKGDAVQNERHAGVAPVIKSFVNLCSKTNLVQDRRTAQCAHGMAAEFLFLRDIPGVQECERHIKETFSAEMSGACMRFIRDGRMAGESDECAVFRSILLRQNQNELFAGERKAS